MIAAITNSASNWYQNLSFNWFDVVLFVVLAFGLWRGRKNGMSREVLPVSMWLIIVIVGGLCAPFLADWLVHSGIVAKVFGTVFDATTAASIISYLFLASVVFFAFSPLRTKFREKVSGSNTFGSGEYYLGMIAGLIRFSCIVLFFLALLNTPVYTPAELAAQKAYNARWFGGGQAGFSGNFFPTLSEVQADVFTGSLSGRIIRNDLGIVLLRTSALSNKSHH
jgi:hypothetical protein